MSKRKTVDKNEPIFSQRKPKYAWNKRDSSYREVRFEHVTKHVPCYCGKKTKKDPAVELFKNGIPYGHIFCAECFELLAERTRGESFKDEYWIIVKDSSSDDQEAVIDRKRNMKEAKEKAKYEARYFDDMKEVKSDDIVCSIEMAVRKYVKCFKNEKGDRVLICQVEPLPPLHGNQEK